MFWTIVGYCVFSLIAWPIWTLIHEFSHLAAAKLIRPILSWKLYPIPGMYEGNWYWARITWVYQLPEMSGWEVFFTSIAPRMPGIVAGILFMFLSLLSGPFQILWIIFWGFGLIDFIWGSIGRSPASDLQKASEAVGWNPWILRIIGIVFVLTCLLVGFLLLL